MAKKTNPCPLIAVFDASKIPPVNAQELLESFKSLLENFGKSGYRLRKVFPSFERCGKCIFLNSVSIENIANSSFALNTIGSFRELIVLTKMQP